MSLRKHFLILAALIASTNAGVVLADGPTWSDATQALNSFGCSASRKPEHSATAISVTCDQKKFLVEMPALQKLGLINPDITQTQLNSTPDLYATGFLLMMTDSLIQPLYRDKKVGTTTWDAGLVVPDLYGNTKREKVFSFKFTRKLNDRINWDNFSATNLPKIAPEFRTTPWGVGALRGQN